MEKQSKNKAIAILEGKQIRRHWDEEKELWYFSVVDVISALTDSVNARDYWFKMKIRVKTDEGSELSTFCRQLKLCTKVVLLLAMHANRLKLKLGIRS